jgi:hypothetical protein
MGLFRVYAYCESRIRYLGHFKFPPEPRWDRRLEDCAVHGSRQELDDNEQYIQPRKKQERGERAWYGNIHLRGSRAPGAARSGGVPVTNVEGAASSTISTLRNTATRRVGRNGSSLLPECRQRNSPVPGERARTNRGCLLVGWPG